MTLIKTSVLSFIATIIKMLSAVVINKAIAVYIGPSGLAFIGQFQNFIQIALTIGQGAINTGVTKYTAEYRANDKDIRPLFSTSIKLSLILSFIVGTVVGIFSEYASVNFLKSDEYSYIFIIFGFTIILFVLNNLLLSILNGLKEIKTFITINIIQSIYSLIFTSLLISFLSLDGVLIAMVTNQSVIFLIVLWRLRKHKVIKIENFIGKFDINEIKKLGGFSAMALTSVLAVTGSLLIIRNHVGETLDWEQAGYLQSMWYISTMYLMVATMALSTYYLPKLSELQNPSELKKEVLQGYKIIMPIVIIASILIYFMKDFIILILFTSEFSDMRDLFFWQLVGDILKMSSWLLGSLLKAKAMFSAFIIKEILISVIFVLLTYALLDAYHLQGVLYAYCLVYIINFIWIFYLVKPKLTERKI